MRPTRKIGVIVLCAWLILTGLFHFFTPRFEGVSTLMAILAIVAGVLLLFDR
jgi:hypothetical protein